MIQWPKCSADNPQNSRFCNYCGEPISAPSQMPTMEASVAETPKAAETLHVARIISSDSVPAGGFTSGTILADRYRVIGLLGRGDRRNATRLASLVMVLSGLSYLFTLDQSSPLRLLLLPWIAGLFWILYLAIEPSVRRRWPQILVGWTRLLSRDWRDPLVARDILVGCAFAVLTRSISHFAFFIVPPWFRHAEQAPFVLPLQSILDIRFFTSSLLGGIAAGLFLYTAVICLLLILTVLLRNQKIVMAVCILTIASVLGFVNAWTFAINIVEGALIFLLLMRFGFLSIAVSFFVAVDLFYNLPITFDTSAWYAGHGFAALAIFAGIIIYAFRFSFGGSPLIALPQLDE
jgi:hypothetical protein